MLVQEISSRQTSAMRCLGINLFVVCLCFFSSYTSAQRVSCTTPNGESARCIPINSCSILYNAVTTQDKQQLKFLKESQCGYRGSPLVCCGSYDNYRSQNTDDDNWGDSDRRTDSGFSNWGNDGGSNWGGTSNRRTNTDNRRTSSEENRWGGQTGGSNVASNRGSGKLPDRSSCGFQDVDRILDGQATGLREFPWMALLQYRKKSGNLVFSCGGSLISSRYVLTAAHCVKGQILTKIGQLVNVRLGEYNTDTESDCTSQLGFQICNDKPVDSEIEKTIVHSDYQDSSADRYHDIALIKLKRDVPRTDFIKPICLPSRSETPRLGDRLVVAGWGRTEYASSSPTKLKLWVPLANPSQCSSRFRSAGVTIGSKQLCAGGERGKDSCNGDSGGPLMATTKNDSAQWYIEGIVSFGARCGSEGWPGIYTKVGEYMDWIQRNID